MHNQLARWGLARSFISEIFDRLIELVICLSSVIIGTPAHTASVAAFELMFITQ
jgi:hypothetical protein